MPNPPQPPHGRPRAGGRTSTWWPLISYVLVSLALLASIAGLGYWAGRRSRPPPIGFAVPTAAPPVPITAYIAGEVAEPGVYTIAPASRVIDLVVAAGGLLPDADHAALNLAARVTDGQRVIVPAIRAAAGPPVLSANDRAAAEGPPRGGRAVTAPAGPVNLNTASPADLVSLPRIGPATAAAIVEWRDLNGGFKSVDDLLMVKGIGTSTLEALRPYVTAP
ncbi:MAG: ComEA family DNA-binding protein [Chloroflexi bacterium]|nr:ComEA family DNA-binding protein [Chloroflexota bacterium]